MVVLGHCEAGHRNCWVTDAGTAWNFASDLLRDVEQAALAPLPSVSDIKSNYNLFWEE